MERFHERYRGCRIVAVYQEEETLDERHSTELLGYLPRVPSKMMIPGKQYGLGHPRSLKEVRRWIDSQLKEGQLKHVE